MYNVEQFIEKCASTLLEQTFKEIEYLFINDCTPDNTLIILEKVIEKFSNRIDQVKIINNKINLGLPSTRNVGLSICKGEYVIHIDGDDYVEPDMVERMYLCAEENDADIVVCDSYGQWGKQKRYHKEIVPENGREYARDIINGKCMPAIWNKLVRRSLYEINNITFPDGINMGEDLATTPLLAYNANKIVKLNKAFVHYILYNNNAYSKNISEKAKSNLQNVVQSLSTYFKDTNNEEITNAIKIRKITTKSVILINSSFIERKKFYNLYNDCDNLVYVMESLPYYYKYFTKLYIKKYFILADLFLKFAKCIKMLKYWRLNNI